MAIMNIDADILCGKCAGYGASWLNRIHALESELQHARHSLEAQRVGIEALSKQAAGLLMENSEIQKINQQIAGERDALKTELSGACACNDVANSEIGQLEADIERRQKNLNIAMATVHRDAVEKQATIDELRKRSEELARSLSAAEAHEHILERQRDELRKRVAELEEQIDVRDRVMNGYGDPRVAELEREVQFHVEQAAGESL